MPLQYIDTDVRNILSSGSKVWPYVKQGVLPHWACDPAHVFTGVSQTKHARKNVKNVNVYLYNPAIFFHLSRVKCGELTDAQKSFPSNVWTPWTGPFWCEAKMVSSWTPSLGATVHLQSTIFPAQSHGLRCGGAHSHPCCFTFGCKLAPVCSECHKIQIQGITLYVIHIFCLGILILSGASCPAWEVLWSSWSDFRQKSYITEGIQRVNFSLILFCYRGVSLRFCLWPKPESHQTHLML